MHGVELAAMVPQNVIGDEEIMFIVPNPEYTFYDGFNQYISAVTVYKNLWDSQHNSPMW